MITTRDIAYGLFGAWRLAHRDKGGMSYIDTSVEGYWKSFFAGAIVLPGFVMIEMLRATVSPEAAPTASFSSVALAFLVAYVCRWIAFPFVMLFVAETIDRSERYIGYIVAFNWAKVIQIAILLPVSALVAVTEAAPFSRIALAGVWFAILAYLWYIARTALDVSGVIAVGLVALELMLIAIIEGVV
ncbi:MAG: hypothetical protein ACE5Q3_19850 [Alphaproteobacteria bacterium]